MTVRQIRDSRWYRRKNYFNYSIIQNDMVRVPRRKAGKCLGIQLYIEQNGEEPIYCQSYFSISQPQSLFKKQVKIKSVLKISTRKSVTYYQQYNNKKTFKDKRNLTKYKGKNLTLGKSPQKTPQVEGGER